MVKIITLRVPGANLSTLIILMKMAFLLFVVLLLHHTAIASGTGIEVDQQSRSLVAPAAQSYQWYYNGQKLEGAAYRNLAVSESGHYRVEVTAANGRVSSQDATILVSQNAIRKIYVIGDSTVATYNASAYPQMGWGQLLQQFFDSQQFVVDNRAIGGRSSRSFHEEGRWTTIYNLLQPDDYVFIQFGHNDRDFTKAERYTDTTNYKAYLRIYVNETRARGAHPVLVTPMNMNTWNNCVVREVFREGGNNYRGAMMRVAEELDVPLIDLNIKSRDLMQEMGQEYATRNLFLMLKPGEYPNYPNGLSDFTHFQEMGALQMAKLVVEGVKELSDNAGISSLVPALKQQYTVTVTSNIAGAGTVSPTSTYPAGVQVTLKALPGFSTTFQNWSNAGGTTVGTNQNVSFQMGTAEVAYQANFEQKVMGSSPIVAGNTYRIAVKHSNLFLDVASSSASNGALVVQSPYAESTSQQWQVNDAGDGYYTLTAVHSNKSMDVEGRSMNDGARLLQYTPGTGTNQQFRIVATEDGAYQLIARHSGKCLNIPANATTCGTNLQQVTCGEESSQKFAFFNISGLTSSATEAEAEAEHAFVYPNPTSSTISIQAEGRFSYVIYNELGKALEQGEGNNQREVGAHLKPGLYFIKLSTANGSRTTKLLKQ